MPSPFPGMDPYLENPQRWRAVHNTLITELMAQLNEQLPPTFVSTVEERVYLTVPDSIYPDVMVLHRPNPSTADENQSTSASALVADAPLTVGFLDEEVYEPYIEIRIAGSEDRVVAVIEVLSPTNKTREAYGRDAYVKKRNQILESGTHLMEIDLLRSGAHSVAPTRERISLYAGSEWQYVVSLHRAGVGKIYDVWPVTLRERLPRVSVPLTADFADIVLDIQACFDRVYEIGAFSRRIDYHADPIPPLSPDDIEWADALLKERGLR